MLGGVDDSWSCESSRLGIRGLSSNNRKVECGIIVVYKSLIYTCCFDPPAMQSQSAAHAQNNQTLAVLFSLHPLHDDVQRTDNGSASKIQDWRRACEYSAPVVLSKYITPGTRAQRVIFLVNVSAPYTILLEI